MKKEIATYSSILVWEIPWAEELVRWKFMGSQESDTMYWLKNNIINTYIHNMHVSSVQSLSHVQICNPMNHSTPGLPVHQQLPEFTQTHAHRIGDVIQPSHPLTSPSPPAPNPSQHQGLFQWVNSSHEVARVLEFQLQHQSFQWTPRTDLL